MKKSQLAPLSPIYIFHYKFYLSYARLRIAFERPGIRLLFIILIGFNKGGHIVLVSAAVLPLDYKRKFIDRE
jgi:hypothetical protein